MATIAIYQNCYVPEQFAKIDNNFLIYDGTHNTPALYEMGAILDLFQTGKFEHAEYVGVVSPKFEQKTNITCRAFKDFILQDPGFDVYFVNPFPQKAYYHFNVWEQGELYHPGICSLTQELFDAVGYKINLSKIGRMTTQSLLYCNYWVGNKKFWNEYMKFILPLFEFITKQCSAEKRNLYFCRTNHYRPTPMFPFVFERMFSTFLSIYPDIKAKFFFHSRDNIKKCCEFELEWNLFQQIHMMIDEWDTEANYSMERRTVFKALGQTIHDYGALYFKNNNPAY